MYFFCVHVLQFTVTQPSKSYFKFYNSLEHIQSASTGLLRPGSPSVNLLYLGKAPHHSVTQTPKRCKTMNQMILKAPC